LVQRLLALPDDDEIRRFISLSMEDRLEWLEEMKKFISRVSTRSTSGKEIKNPTYRTRIQYPDS